MFFKCKNCEGNMVYSPEKKEMFCPYCDSLNSHVRSDQGKDVLTICPNCSGEITVGEYDASGRCPYCDTYLIYNSRVEGEYLPKKIIPFKLGKEACKKAIRDRFGRQKFAPVDFLTEVKLDTIEGEYVPFWFYDYKTRCEFRAEGTKVRSWVNGNTRYTETSYYDIERNMDIPFENLPVDASIKMPDEVMDMMEPYNYAELEDFQPEYLSGFLSERYNMPSEELEQRASEKMNQAALGMLKSSYAGYARVEVKKQEITPMSKSTSYGMLPVWKYNYTYQGKPYPFYVNGQTGKIVGECPLSKKKVWVYSGSLWVLLMLAFALINGILRFL